MAWAAFPLSGTHRLGDAAVHNPGIGFLKDHMAQVAGQGWMGLEFGAQQGIRIDAEAKGLIAEIDAAEMSLRAHPAGLWRSNVLARA